MGGRSLVVLLIVSILLSLPVKGTYTVVDISNFREKMSPYIPAKIIKKLLDMLVSFEYMLANLFGNLLNKLLKMFEKLIDKRIVFGNLIGELPSMFENWRGGIPNMYVNLPNKFSNKFHILIGVFGDVSRDNFRSNSCCDCCRIGKTGGRRILCSMQ